MNTVRWFLPGALVICCGLLPMVLPSPASAQEDQDVQPVVAILDFRFDGVTMPDSAVERMNQYLASRVAGEGFYLVVPRDQVARAMVEQKVKAQDPCHGSCSVTLGGAVGANKVMHGMMMKVGDECAVILDLLDLQTETMERSVEVPGLACTESGLRDGISKGARQISARAALPGFATGTVGGGTVTQGVSIDRGESIVNAMTDETGLLFITTDPPKANIFLNGKPYGKAPYQDALMVGRYVVTATLNTYYHDASQEIVLTTAGATVNLTLPPAFGTLKISSQPSDAEVLIDDKPVGRTPYTDTQMKSGEYRVEVRKDLYTSDVQQVVVIDGQSVNKSVTLKEDFGGLKVASNPSGAAITIDGQATGSLTPATFRQLATGIHVVTLDLEGHGRRVDNVKVAAGVTEQLNVQLEPKLGMLTVMTEDGEGAPCQGTLSIDGKPMGTTPWKGNLIATAHTVEAKCGDGAKSETVTIEHNASRVLKIRMDASAKGYVKIPTGSFLMGSPSGEAGRYGDEGPQTRVTINRPFMLKATEVTQGEWKAVMGTTPSNFTSCGEDCPVEQVSWNDAVEYCNRLSKKESLEQCYDKSGDSYTFLGLSCKGYRLPTEAEWEYAARAGSAAARYGDINAVAWYDQNSGSKTHPVGQKQQNAWGLYDMLGNVYEWCSDWKGDYGGGAVTNPTGPSTGSNRVARGGSWYLDARLVRAAYRNGFDPGYRDFNLGFRPARSVR